MVGPAMGLAQPIGFLGCIMFVPYRIFRPTTRILSSTSAPDILHWVTQSLESNVACLLLDLQDVIFMDSSGLGALVIASKRVKKVGGRLALCSLSGQARMAVEMSSLDTILEIYDTPQDFLQLFSSQDSMRSPHHDSSPS